MSSSVSFFGRLWRTFRLYRIASQNPRAPAIAKILPWLSLLYIIWPIDFIPDVIPLLGQLDDVAMIPILIFLALRLIPKDIRDSAEEELRKNDIIDV